MQQGARKISFAVAIFGCFLLLCSKSTRAGEFEKGKTYFGFKLLDLREIPDIACQGMVFEHQRSGARLFKLKNDDDNKTFMITFLTPPPDDTGLPHIVEHAVLAGSRKFPVKDPFRTMAKGSLSTFLNAITIQDRTMYPLASRNTQEFFNLMDVYLDAVFYPRIYEQPLTFLQEGWRYELAHKDAPLTYNGVVYNEMKGAFSSPYRVIGRATAKALFPNNEYGNESGGYPMKIPKLTRKAFLAFHKRYYHPSNAYINLYGDGDTLAELKFLDNAYLARFKRSKNPRAIIARHKPTTAMKEVTVGYSVAANETTADKTYLGLTFVFDNPQDPGFSMSMSVLADALINQRSAPIRKALKKAGIGKEVGGGYSDMGPQGRFGIVVLNANQKDKDRFKKTVFDTLRAIAQRGLDKKEIEALLNRYEFHLREAAQGGQSKGIVYSSASQNPWILADDPFRGLQIESSLAQVRRALTTNELENLIRTRLIDNPYSLFVVGEPKPGLSDEIERKRKEELAKKKANMKPAQIQELVAQTKRLKEYQRTPDKPEDLAKIPMLSRADLEPKATKLDLVEHRVNGVRVMHHQAQTNGIVYLRLLFDASVVPEEMIQTIPLLTAVMGGMDTQKHSYSELNTALNMHTGGLSFYLQTYVDQKHGESYFPKVVVNAKVLTKNFGKLVDLSQEIMTSTRYADKTRLSNIFGRLSANAEHRARNRGLSMALTRLRSYLSPVGYYEELTEGLSYIHFIKDLEKRFTKDANNISADLELLASLIFNRKNLIVGVTCSAKDYKHLERHLPRLMAGLGKKDPKIQKYVFDRPALKNEGLLAASRVNFVTLGANFKQLGHRYSGKMLVMGRILDSSFLHGQIREQGGAYGAWSSFWRTGISYLASTRDPNLERTLDVYKKSTDFLKSYSPSEREMTRYIIGAIGAKDKPLTPAAKGRIALARYLGGWTHRDQQKERDEILATTASDIRDLSKIIAKIIEKDTFCVYGNENQLTEKKDIFGGLIKVIE